MALLSIITYNVNSIRSRYHILDYLFEKYDPTILCLQETKVADGEFPTGYFYEKGHDVYYSGEKGKSGVSVSFKRGIKAELVSKGLNGKDRSRLLELKFEGFYLFNLYVPQGRSPEDDEFKHKLDFLDEFIGYIDSKFKRSDPVIIVGDLNIAPTDIDVHDPKRLYGHVCFRDEVWSAYRRLIDWGFVDIFRKFNEGRVYTFYDYRVKDAVERGLGWRVDHVLVTAPLAERAIGCGVDLTARKMEKPSDHVPVIAKFDL